MDLKSLTTEQQNQNSMNLDSLSVREILELMNEETKNIPLAIDSEIPGIVKIINATIDSLNKGGRLIYLGAGTSGRLGILDAVECVPTFSTDPDMVQGIIAGGEAAMMLAVEGAEDSKELGRQDLIDRNLSKDDVVVGIAASGRTPYVIGGLEYANEIGATTASVCCNKNAEISKYATFSTEIDAGPEVLTGSTRLKAGTSQKLVLNMISTASMIGIGKTYKNLMVDVKPTNQKLIERAKGIVMTAAECDYETAESALQKTEGNVKVAIVMVLCHIDVFEAKELLKKSDGFISKIVN
ncbi:N-acetylmuramic acid 6-phosphate etherase [Vagococcus sp. PNs007]|uniref:N-acetylmuramic acid 6-phosphate etherase n=1 Tax=Vagococcus proximus TaxID=2991417 RepID=A0ABT5WZ72_9ENTE|nr:N-acetylmuramic acid 6-phosphate etherase [Vagococcus proximus]MDF0478939.1 N-acetylmuramic acid 6-phosphate etherase [Vagococcus proximus]